MRTDIISLETYMRWIQESSQLLDLKLVNFQKISEIAPYDTYLVTITVDGKTSRGSGISRTPEKAFLTAVSEAIERIAFEHLFNRPTSSGIAVHTDSKMAGIKASSELIERDRFFCHYLTQTPFSDLTEYFFSKHKDAQNIQLRLKPNGLSFKIGELKRTRGFHTVLSACLIEDQSELCPTGGVTIGLGCEVDLEKALEKAFAENLKSSLGIIGRSSSFHAISVEEFLGFSRPSILAHQQVSLQKKARDNILKLFPRSIAQNVEAKLFVEREEEILSRITITEKPLFNLIHGCPLKASWADSTDLQQAFYGPTTFEQVNLGRISEFMGRQITFDSINQFPHPFA